MPVIPLAFLLLAGLLLWAVIYGRGHWLPKLLLILATPAIATVIWLSLGSFQGWGTSARPPRVSVFVAAEVFEPDPKTGDPGVIYLWLIPPRQGGTFTYRSRDGEPRYYRQPYSRDLHEQVLRAMRLAASGHPVMLERPGSHRSTLGHFLITGHWHAYRQPPVTFHPKP